MRCAPFPERRETSSFASTAVAYVMLLPPPNPPKLKLWIAGVVALDTVVDGTTTQPLAAGARAWIPCRVQLALTRASFTQAPACDVSAANARLPCVMNWPPADDVESGPPKRPIDWYNVEFADNVSVLCSS